MKHALSLLLFAGAGVSALAFVASAKAESEAVTHAVNDYAWTNGTGYCCSTCDDLTNALTDASKFNTGGAFATIYDQLTNFQNMGVDGADFTDASQYSGGADSVDPYGTDYADVIFFSGHASWSSSGNYAYLVMGDSNPGETCFPRIADDTAVWRHMEFGNGGSGQEADAFVLFACNSAQYEVWEAGGYNLLSHSAGQFNLLNGFHGIVWEISGYQTDLQNYAADARYDAIGDAWIDRMYNNDGSSDNCPMPILWGANAAETDDYYSNAGWLDFHNTGARSGTLPRIHYICGCDPVDGEALSSC
jgi:hypothetical protein